MLATRAPARVLSKVALHEAIHALYGFTHSERGLMCSEPDCLLERGKGTRLDDLDDAVFSLYGLLPHDYPIEIDYFFQLGPAGQPALQTRREPHRMVSSCERVTCTGGGAG